MLCAEQLMKDNEGLFPPELNETENKNFYVGDCLKSVRDEYSAISLVPKLGQLLSKGGFHLINWMSNTSRVLATIPESERAKSVKDFQLGDIPPQRALGVKWNLESDTFVFIVNVKEKPPTRRGILSLGSSVYDPLGFASPVVLPAKVILQDLCCRGLKRDEVVPEEHCRTGNSGFVIFYGWKNLLFIAVLNLVGLEMLAFVNPITLGTLRKLVTVRSVIFAWSTNQVRFIVLL